MVNKIIIIKKNGDVEEKNVKEFCFDNVYKYCGYKNNNDFEKIHQFIIQKNNKTEMYNLYGKTNGRANYENKYDLPPPVDNKLFFGTLAVVRVEMVENEIEMINDLTLSKWEKVYEDLFGGFEDITGDDSERSEDTEIYSDDEYTKEGYLKDDFIVDDDELEEEEYQPYDSE